MAIQTTSGVQALGMFSTMARTVMAAEKHEAEMSLVPLRRETLELDLRTAGIDADKAEAQYDEWLDNSENRKKLNNLSVSTAEHANYLSETQGKVANSMLLYEEGTRADRIATVGFERERSKLQNSLTRLQITGEGTSNEARVLELKTADVRLKIALNDQRAEEREEEWFQTTRETVAGFNSEDMKRQYEQIKDAPSGTDAEIDTRHEMITAFRKEWDATGAGISKMDSEALKHSGFVDYGANLKEWQTGQENWEEIELRARQRGATKKDYELRTAAEAIHQEEIRANEDVNASKGESPLRMDWTTGDKLTTTISAIDEAIAVVKRMPISFEKAQKLAKLKLVRDSVSGHAIVKGPGLRRKKKKFEDIKPYETIKQSLGVDIYQNPWTVGEANEILEGISEQFGHLNSNKVPPNGLGAYNNIEGLLWDFVGEENLPTEFFDTAARRSFDSYLRKTKITRIEEERRIVAGNAQLPFVKSESGLIDLDQVTLPE